MWIGSKLIAQFSFLEGSKRSLNRQVEKTNSDLIAGFEFLIADLEVQNRMSEIGHRAVGL